MVLLLGGSRVLSSAGLALVSRLCPSLVARPGGFVAGCAAGADAAFLSRLVSLGAGSRVSLFCVSRPGAWPSSSAASLLASSCGSVVSGAGGGPAVPLRARFAVRSRAAAAAASSGLFVVSSASSRGSLVCAAVLASRGCPVWFSCVGFSGPPVGLPGCAGS